MVNYFKKYLSLRHYFHINKINLVGGATLISQIENLLLDIFKPENAKFSTKTDYFNNQDYINKIDTNFLDELYPELNSKPESYPIRDKMVQLRRLIKQFIQEFIDKNGY